MPIKLCIEHGNSSQTSSVVSVFPASEHCIRIIAFSQHPVEIVGVTSPPLEMWSWGTRRTRWEIDTNFRSLVWAAWVFKVLTVAQKKLSIKHTKHYLHYSTQRRTDVFTRKLLVLFQITWTQTLKCNNIRTKPLSSAVASENKDLNANQKCSK